MTDYIIHGFQVLVFIYLVIRFAREGVLYEGQEVIKTRRYSRR